ncbi:TPA: hypothetical protein QEM39_000658 [Pseudomonas putida]|uniref:hypothetical protein n=1 Tax=Pseudomonas putida TaxID=303 RepID=UPI00236495A1|nr:hypothetical protein [Pseudomonas putida]MDD2150769.1 hypothetical protein [Pseudomonas putida]HDS1679181.1 hypothetical protein [Pseudomonas putida]
MSNLLAITTRQSDIEWPAFLSYPPRIFYELKARLRMAVSSFVVRSASVKGVCQGFATFVGALGGLWYICDTLVQGGDPLHPLIWACTVTFFAFVFYALFSYCAYAQMIMQDEIDRISKTKEELEAAHLKRRLSSDGGKK